MDTGASCLSLPRALFDALFAWLPAANCTEATALAATATSRGCRIPPTFDASTLPVLTFRLAQHAHTLQLPLEEMLTSAVAADGSREFCILPRESSLDSGGVADGPLRPQIIVGTFVRRHMLNPSCVAIATRANLNLKALACGPLCPDAQALKCFTTSTHTLTCLPAGDASALHPSTLLLGRRTCAGGRRLHVHDECCALASSDTLPPTTTVRSLTAQRLVSSVTSSSSTRRVVYVGTPAASRFVLSAAATHLHCRGTPPPRVIYQGVD